MRTRFFKYHGLGNDFVIIDRRAGGGAVTSEQARRICDRRRGIGADGVLSLFPSEGAAARMEVLNADGSPAEMCGNGLRCAVKHLADSDSAPGGRVTVLTGKGLLSCEVRFDGKGLVSEVTADIGPPELSPARIPMRAEGDRFVRRELSVRDEVIIGTAVSMGNPHFVLFGEPSSRAATLGPKLERHPIFPSGVNVEFATVCGEGLEVRVWERGCGFTEACGTGACAAVVAACLEGLLPAGTEREVRLPGGTLFVLVLEDLSRVYLRGPATRVFEGDIEL
jgi:diaminopimelate epimerase